MNKQVWIDIETTGVDYKNDSILQVAVIITDKDFNILEEHSWIVKQDERVRNTVSEDVKQMHLKTGLWDKIENGIDQETVDFELFKVLRRAQPEDKISIGGSSVHFDMNMLVSQFSYTGPILSHRVMDISAARLNWEFMGHDIKFPEHTVSHEALDDIKWSIVQAKTIKEYVDSL